MDRRLLRVLLARRAGLYAGLLEIFLIGVLWTAYSLSRLLASNDLSAAMARAKELSRLERYVGLDWEHAINSFFVRHDMVGLFGSYWYSVAHYIVTLVVLVWLYRFHRSDYIMMRRALLVSTLLALGLYLLLPTAPPRFVDGFTDVLNLHSAQGWWGADASAPRGMGQLTNELAAFPSLHAGWALWVAIATYQVTRSRVLRTLGVAHALITAVVIVGTGNHWMLDVICGWLVVLVGCVAVAPFTPIVEARPISPASRRPHAPAPLGPVRPADDGALARGAESGSGS
ncbi:PAP2 superfamily protein [Nocardioides terrae]|uniref:PAP2 superfamily protein n=1 Tax=Nocardioides terrae TaxID=574651 RepID=A0A1I1I1Q6_9ACTN|nr:phosphatase PAP2 family protein [Nocardioides terrae]SFC30031.1 PAP2 superfamily protein [Nocardioides terrae]